MGWVKRNQQIQKRYFQVWIRKSMQMGLYPFRRTALKYTQWYRRVSRYTDWRVRIRKYLVEVYRNSVPGEVTNFYSDDGSKILCNVRTLLHGVTSKKTARFTLSAITETTGINAIHDTTWQREYAVQHNSTFSALTTGLNTARCQCNHTIRLFLLNSYCTFH